jgi:quercetin dioxygenase-like cupin family protein
MVPKGWGAEFWIANKPEYCGKILSMQGGKQMSWHYHKLKDETFSLLDGVVTLLWSMDDCMVDGKFDPSLANVTQLQEGDVFHVPRGMKHRLIAHVPSRIMEVSTQHFEEDSYRLEKGD